MEPARGSWLPWKHMHFSICRKRSPFDWLCTPVLCPTTGFGVTTDCSKHPEKPSLSVVGCSGGDGFCDLAGGLGLAFTKNNPPDFGLLFLAQFARFSIRTETEVTVHTHSQTNRHLHLCPTRSGLWKFGFVGPLASNARWAGSISDQASGPAAEPVSKL